MLKSLKFSFIISALAYIILGSILLVSPNTSLKVICYAFGGITLFYGLLRFTNYLSNRENSSLFQGDAFWGIILTGLGIFFLIKPDLIHTILPIVIGLFIILNSIIKLQYAFELKFAHYEKWWILLFLGLFTTIIGVIVSFNPFKAMQTIMEVMGIALVFDGIANIFTILFTVIVLRHLKRVATDLALAGTVADSVIDNDEDEVKEAKIIVEAEETDIQPIGIESQPTISEIFHDTTFNDNTINTEKITDMENLEKIHTNTNINKTKKKRFN